MTTGTDEPIRLAWHNLLREEREEAGPKPTADGTLFRASGARMCIRERAMKALDMPPDHDVSDNSLRAFNRGNAIHDDMQRVVVERWGGDIEVVATHMPDYEESGSADGLYDAANAPEIPIDEGLVLAEIKSMKKFGWNLSVYGKGDPRWKKQKQEPGPKPEHVTQAAVYGIALGAVWLHMIYVNKNDDDIHEWVVHLDSTTDVLTGEDIGSLALTPRQYADEELALVAEATEQVRNNIIPAAFMPGFGLIEDPPEHGAKRGNPWLCRFCDFNRTCRALGPEAFAIDGDINEEQEAA